MDKEYLELCESCPLLESWKPKIGDRYYLKNDLYATIEDNEYSLVVNKSKATERGSVAFKTGVNYVPLKFGWYDTFFGLADGSVELRKHSFWVPYIDQLQEMCMEFFPSFFYLYSAFFKFAFDPEANCPIKYFDINSIWLLFYAKENYLLWNYDKKEWEDE